MDTLDITAAPGHTPAQILKRMFSMKTYLQVERTANSDLRNIGEGQCGIIFALVGGQYVMKLPKDGKIDALWQDYVVHRKVEEVWKRLPTYERRKINIPNALRWANPKCEELWAGYQHCPEAGFRKGYGLISQRILPLPEPVREALFRQFAPPLYKSKEARAAQPLEDKNLDCLVRVYLGRRLTRKATPGFKLRNFDLMINEMEDLRLDPAPYAKTMAQTLAMLHWGAGVDANDVEFVLGCAPSVKPPPTPSELKNMGPDDPAHQVPAFHADSRCSIGLWLLDFNQCATFTHDEAGLKQLVDGFWWNDPYYPRPGSNDKADKQLWAIFKEIYLTASEQYIQGISKGLAAQFITEVEKRSEKQSQTLRMRLDKTCDFHVRFPIN